MSSVPESSLPWRAAFCSLRVSVGERQTDRKDKGSALAEAEPCGSRAGGRLMRPRGQVLEGRQGWSEGVRGSERKMGVLRLSLGDPRNKCRPGRQRDRQTDRGTDRGTDREPDRERQTEGQTEPDRERQTEGQTDRQGETDRHSH